jgi:excisionase family DNA binding protein
MELMTVQEAADALHVSAVTVRRYIARGRLRAVRVGRGLRIEKDAVDQLPEPVLEPLPEDWPETARKYLKYYKPIPEGDYNPFGAIIGLFDGADEGATDVSSNKHKYLADAYLETHTHNGAK